MISDLKFALRQLAKSPGYTLVVVLTLALGVAVNTNIFGIVGPFFLQDMPVPDASRLALILERSDAFSMPHGISFPDFRDYRARSASFAHLLAYFPQAAHISTDGHEAERGWIEVVSANRLVMSGQVVEVLLKLFYCFKSVQVLYMRTSVIAHYMVKRYDEMVPRDPGQWA